ncbi:MAG: ThiF family adenylyltransferase [Phycisphaerae bacterium]
MTPASDRAADPLARYSRQVLFEPIGPDRQRRLMAGRATLIGCGALGTVIADVLVRAGVGFLRLIDRDLIELNNLQRQVLYDEQDLAEGLPKAAAAAAKLRRINAQVTVEPHVVDVNRTNVESLIDGADVVLDGTDNFETRFLVNDAAVKRRVPWIYGACIGATGLVLPIVPHETPCLRCIWTDPPPPGSSPTCDTAGVLATTVHVVAALQALEAIKLLAGQATALNRRLQQLDVWRGRFDTLDVQAARSADCRCCGQGQYDWLNGAAGGGSATLCGRNAVQVSGAAGRLDLAQLAERVARVVDGPPRLNRYMLRFSVGGREFAVFADGRAIIQGTSDVDEARTAYAKYVGA